MNRCLRNAVAAAAGSALLLVAVPAHAVAQTTQPTRCLAAYQDRVFMSNIQQVVVYEPPETVTLYPGHAVTPVMLAVDATVGYVNCTLGGLS